MPKLSKRQQIINHLQSGQPLSSWECIQLYRHTRLGAVIHELRQQGWDITTQMRENAQKDGHHAVYHLVKEAV